jgi:hypothetical protein
MKLRLIYILIIAAACIVITGCEKVVNGVKVPEFERKLAVSAFISPSDTHTLVTISVNKRIFGNLSEVYVPGVFSGTISDGERTVPLQKGQVGYYFRKSGLEIHPDREYRLVVSSSDGLLAEAECKVPPARTFEVEADTFERKLFYVPDGYPDKGIDMTFTIYDIPGEENYYRIWALARAYYKNPYDNKNYISRRQLYFEEEFFSDKGADGKAINVKTNSGLSYYYTMDSVFVIIHYYNLDKPYYLYHSSLRKYSGADNPFTEISPVYSNIKGGLGIFASYTSDSLVYRLK